MGLLVQAEALNDATGTMHGATHEMMHAVMGDLSNVVEAGMEDHLARVDRVDRVDRVGRVGRVVEEAPANNAHTRAILKETVQARIAATNLDMRIKAITEVVIRAINSKIINSRIIIVLVPAHSHSTSKRIPMPRRHQPPFRFRLRIRVRRLISPSRVLVEASRIRR